MSATGVNQALAIDIRQVLTAGTSEAVESWLGVVEDPVERARQLAKLSSSDWHRLGELLDSETGPDVIESIDADVAAGAIQAMAVPKAAMVIDTLDSDHATKILRQVDDRGRDKLLTALPPTRADVLRALLSWAAGSAAAHMLPETLTVAPTMTASDAIAAVREHASHLRSDSRTAAYIYVTGPGEHLLGVVSFRKLMLSPADSVVADLMDPDLVTVSPLTDEEQAAQTLIDHRLIALPVVDDDGRLLGIVTADGAAGIAEEEATEDAERQGGSAPLETSYLRASPFLLWRKRIVWLLVLFIAEAYTGTVLRAFEHELEAVVALAFFIPLLIGTGGNTGTQITTTLVRAMATRQIRLRDLPAILVKELSTGVLIGVVMGLAAVIRAWTLGVGPQVTLTVSLSVVAIVLWSSFVASILPPLLKKIRFDPAVVSAPMIATIVDGTGLIIYFMIACMTLPELAGFNFGDTVA
ncbi:MAG: magnesium transporter [Mycolicibacterium sp.]|nr:magnesium transporter [Mycolicibacterium sp.]